MSGIIDDIIFQTLEFLADKQVDMKDSTPIYEIFHKLKVNQKYHIATNNAKIYETKSTFDMPQKTFLVNLHVKKEAFNTKFTAVEINQLTNQKITSKHNDLLAMKEYFKRHKEFPAESNVYINNGRTYLVMNNFLPSSKLLRPSRIMQVYNSLIIKNLLNFENFIKKYIQNREKKAEEDPKRMSLFHKQLQIARIVNTTHSTANISIDKSQFKFANNSFQRRKGELISIKEMIEEQVSFQKTAQKLYQIVPEQMYAGWIKQNYIDCYMENQKKLHSLLTLTAPSQRKLQDFVYNMVKIQVKEKIGGNNPLDSGGYSFIFGIRADVTYISSLDMMMLPKNVQKVQRFLAIKRLKNFDPKKPNNKIQHQKELIQKMRGSICQFLPKYYGTQRQNQFQNCLIMELIQGEDLDQYVSSRVETITLWSKIYLLLNIIHGMRHLINYQITHLDLKPLNIKVVRNMVTKIFDFGQAYHPQLCSKDYVAASTFPYAAPQVFTRFCKSSLKKLDNTDWSYSQKQDSYAFGVIMYEIIFGDNIYSLSQNKLKESCLKKQTFQRIYLAPERVEDYGQNKIMSNILYMVARCLDLDPAKRPCFEWIGISLKLMLNSYINIS